VEHKSGPHPGRRDPPGIHDYSSDVVGLVDNSPVGQVADNVYVAEVWAVHDMLYEAGGALASGAWSAKNCWSVNG